MKIPYRVPPQKNGYCCDEYDVLIGPNGFECVLTEPEDRIWSRDLRIVVDELNRLYTENKKLKRRLRDN